jgi:hypothetical protein
MDTSWIEEVVHPLLKEGFDKLNMEAQDIKYELKDGKNGAMLIAVDAVDEFEVYKISIERLV